MNSGREQERYRAAYDGVRDHLNNNGVRWPASSQRAGGLNENLDELLLRFERVKRGPVGSKVQLSGYMTALLNVRQSANRTPDISKRTGSCE